MATTGLSVAMARGQSGSAGAVVICRGLTVVTVLVDADGQPVEAQHLCPDAVLALFVDVGVAATMPQVALSWAPVDRAPEELSGVARPARTLRARGPPVLL